MQHMTIRVHGRVQGVFFRDSLGQEAEQLGLTGLVRNDPDGTVYIEAEGADEALNRLVAWCHTGPTHAQPQRVEVRKGKIKGFKSFTIEW